MSAEFSAKLSALRKEKEISQRKAAEDLQISQALLSHYEKGIRECNLDFVKRAAVYYDVSADYLLGLSDIKKTRPDFYTGRSPDEDGLTAGAVTNAISFAAHCAAAAGTEAEAFFCGYFCLALKKYAINGTGKNKKEGLLTDLALCRILSDMGTDKRKAPDLSDPPPAYSFALENADRKIAETVSYLTE